MTCPNGFVIPDDVNSPDNWYPNRTLSECAFRCADFVVYSAEEWDNERMMIQCLATLGFIGLFVVLIGLTIDKFREKTREHGYFMELFAVVLIIKALSELIIFSRPVGERLCRNNANFLDESDGITGCSIHAHVTLQTTVIFIIAWCLECIYLMCKVVFKYSMVHMVCYRRYIMVGIAIAPTLLTGGNSYRLGGTEGYSYCTPDNSDTRLAPVQITVLLLISVGIICVLVVVVYVIWYACTSVSFIRYTSRVRPVVASESGISMGEGGISTVPCSSQHSGINLQGAESTLSNLEVGITNDTASCKSVPVSPVFEEEIEKQEREGIESSWSLIMALRVPLAFVIFFVLFFSILMLVFSRAECIDDEHEMIEEWGDCVLRHYDGTDGSWVSSCGAKPHTLLGRRTRNIAILMINGLPLWCCLLFAPRLIKQFQILRSLVTADRQ